MFKNNKHQKIYNESLLPIDIHFHGIQGHDFSNYRELNLIEINKLLYSENVQGVLTGFLPKTEMNSFLSLMNEFRKAKNDGKLSNIIGFALEGPLLSSTGGTPKEGTWQPTKNQWEKIASCGEIGLKYIVLSPDEIDGILTSPDQPTLEWIVELLVENQIRISLGHFRKENPSWSAKCIKDTIKTVEHNSNKPLSEVILTDHFLNDMPQNTINHAWRSQLDKKRRPTELSEMRINSWTQDNLEEKLGVVPAVLINAARDGLITMCMNFDGEHVDLDICKKVVDFIGEQSMVCMTDRAWVDNMCGKRLYQKEGETLLYKEDGIVAAGSQSLTSQVNNMRMIGFTEQQVWKSIFYSPAKILGLPCLGNPEIVSVQAISINSKIYDDYYPKSPIYM